MSYIGATPVIGNFQKCDAITTSATDTFNLLVGGAAVSPISPQNCIVSLNGVVQAPTSAYTISGSTIVFASALTTSDVIDFIVILGNVLDIGTPSDDTVTAAKLNDTAISGQTALGAEPADTDEFLVSDAGTLKRVDYSYIKPGSTVWNKLQKVTISDDALIEFDTTYITSAYSVYKFIISDLVPETDDQELYCQFKHGGSYQTSANGWVVMQFNTNSATVNATGDSNSTQIRLTNDNLGNTGGENSYWELTLDNPLGTANVKKMGGVGYIYDADQKYRCDNFLGGSSYLGGVVTAIDALKFYMESGNLTSGTITLYGITT